MTAQGRVTQPSSMDAPGNLPEQRAQAVCPRGTGALGGDWPVGGTGMSPVLSPSARATHWRRPRRSGFTLVELLITVSVIAIMASMILFALFAAQETAKVQKTKALIAKLDAIIKAKYESYKTRRVPITLPPPPAVGSASYATYVQTANLARIDCLRDLMRMELPDRWSDVEDNPKVFYYGGTFGSVQVQRPSNSQSFFRQWNAASPKPTGEFAGAECLYMIIMSAQQDEADDRSAIKADQIGDTDGDGFPELLDAWQRPIKFLRWAPGFISELQVVATGTVNGDVNPVDAHTMTVTGAGRSLSQTAGSYVGGAIIGKKTASDEFDINAMGFLGNYSYAAGTATFTSTTPTYTGQRPFRGMGGPRNPQDFFVMAPDPFDPRHVYPLYSVSMGNTPPNPDTSIPTFALYPLIYSGGPDKCFGICADFGSSGALRYTTVNDNPFYVGTDAVDGQQRFIGSQRDEPLEPNFVTRAWVDNIHNHMITAR